MRRKIPESLRAQLLHVNDHTCCICNEPRKHVQIHHIDSNPSKNEWDNLAVLCLDCHSRVTGDEGLGTRYSPREVALYKQKWEAEDGNDQEEEEEQPEVLYDEEVVVRSGEEIAYRPDLDRDELLIVAVESDKPVDVFVTRAHDHDARHEDRELSELDGREDVLRAELHHQVEDEDLRVVVVSNPGDKDAQVEVTITVWPPDDDDDDHDEE